MLVVLYKYLLDGNNGQSLGQSFYCIKKSRQDKAKMLPVTVFHWLYLRFASGNSKPSPSLARMLCGKAFDLIYSIW